METNPICDWPGCSREALCTSGNAGGAFVCAGHFTITNGTCAEELSTLEMAAMRVMARRADRRHTQNERKAMIISFAWTTPALLAGRKTVTRRFWKDDYARRMIQHAIVQGRPVDAYNKSPQWGGKKIAQLRIMSIRKERLGLLLEDPSYGNEEMEKEGGDMFWVDLKDFVGAWSHSFNPDCEMWRIEFEVLELTK